jgi:MurNAc alpha-1-phosphate uridylyltransferase
VIGFCLAAGAGSRLAPLTASVPKPLLAPAGRPLLELACDALGKAGAGRMVVNLHHGAEAIAGYLAGRTDVALAHEPKLLGTGGGLVAARRAGLLGARGDDALVLVTCADHVVDPADLAALAAALERSGAPMAMGVGRGPGEPTFHLDGDRAAADPGGRWIAAGVFALRARLLDRLEPSWSTMLDALLEPCWRRGELLGVPLRGAWADAGTLARFLDVSAGLLEGRWPYPLPPGELRRDRRAAPVFLAAGARLDPGVVVAGPLVLDRGARLGGGAFATRSVLGPGATVGAGARVSGSILGPGATLPPGELAVAALLPATAPGTGAGGIG